MTLTKAPAVISGENVYQEGDKNILPFLEKMVEDLILPGSGFDGLENLEELYAKAEAGKSCLILPEHYSNLDLPLFSYLLSRAGGRGGEIANSIIAIAGMKLNEDNPVISAFTSAYTRIVIYPSRSILSLDAIRSRKEIKRSNAINRSAMKILLSKKNKGHPIMIFPSGTRFRPWDPTSKRGVREIDSYIKTFDYMCMISINGEVLHIRQGDMLEDTVSKDVVRVGAGKVLSCREFRERIHSEMKARTGHKYGEDSNDKKQTVADAIMTELEKMHIEGEERRKKLIQSNLH